MLLPVPSVPHFEWRSPLRWALGRIHQMPAGTRWLPASALRYPFRANRPSVAEQTVLQAPAAEPRIGSDRSPPTTAPVQQVTLRPGMFEPASTRFHTARPAKLGPSGRRFAGVTPREVTPGQLARARSMVKTAVAARREARSPPGRYLE